MARLSARSVVTCGMPYLSATSRVLSRSRLIRLTTSTSGMRLMPSRCLMPKAPAPASATLMVMLPYAFSRIRWPTAVLDAGTWIEAVRDLGRGTLAGHVAHGATGDQPHHQLDAFAAGFAHVFDVRHLGQAAGSAISRSRRRLSHSRLMRPARGPCSWWLMPPVPQICTFSVFVKRLDGAADGLTQLEAAPARGHRVLHHVDRKRNHRAGPGAFGRAEHQVQRHGQAMVHVHLVDDGEVEVLLDDRLRDVRGQFRVAHDLGHRARPQPSSAGSNSAAVPMAKVGIRSRLKAGGVVVVDQEDHVGQVLLHPLLGRLVTRKHGCQ
jgi:hypothetical protein